MTNVLWQVFYDKRTHTVWMHKQQDYPIKQFLLSVLLIILQNGYMKLNKNKTIWPKNSFVLKVNHRIVYSWIWNLY
jgi:hypothetical protein